MTADLSTKIFGDFHRLSRRPFGKPAARILSQNLDQVTERGSGMGKGPSRNHLGILEAAKEVGLTTFCLSW